MGSEYDCAYFCKVRNTRVRVESFQDTIPAKNICQFSVPSQGDARCTMSDCRYHILFQVAAVLIFAKQYGGTSRSDLIARGLMDEDNEIDILEIIRMGGKYDHIGAVPTKPWWRFWK